MDGRDKRGRFVKGGGAGGRKPGSRNKVRIDAKALIEPHVPRLIEILKNAAENGDVAAARVLIDRVVPSVKAEDRAVHLPELADPALSVGERMRLVNVAVAQGRLTLDQGQTLSRMLEGQAKVEDLEHVQAVLTLVRRGWDVHDAIAEVDRRGVAALDDEEVH